MDLDSSQSIRQAFSIIRLRRPFNTDGLEVMGQAQAFVGGLFCDGSLAEL